MVTKIRHHRMKERQRSRSRDRVQLHAQVPQVPQTQFKSLILYEDSAVVNPSPPSAGPLPSAEQRGRSRREQRSRPRERAPPHVPPHASQQPQPVVPPLGAQQIHPLATQGTDEDSATVEPQSRVSDRSRSPQRGSTEKGFTKTKRKTIAEMKQPSGLPKANKHKSMDSDEDDEEPQNEPGSSSNSQPIVPVLPLHQGPASSSQEPTASSQGPAAFDNSADEDSEYSDEKSARSQDSRRTVFYPDLSALTDDGH